MTSQTQAEKIARDELLPCPFCGGEAVSIPSGPPSGAVVRCGDCGARTVSDYQGEAAKRWNARAAILATEAAPSEPVAWPTDEQVWDCLRLTFSEADRAPLSFKRWKDGIDVDIPTAETMLFAKQLFAMGLAAAHPDTTKSAPQEQTPSEPTDAELTAAWNEGTFRIYDDVRRTMREAFDAGYRLHRRRSGSGPLVEAVASLIESDGLLQPNNVSVEAYRKAHIIVGLTAPDPAVMASLATAVGHIEHMAAWIAKQNAGYSFESLGEDLPDIKALLAGAQ